jgi:SpoVK/Ycf46/Vps4 family AAA+-type ATPase
LKVGTYLLEKPGRKFPDELSGKLRETYDMFIMPPKGIIKLEDVILSDENRHKFDTLILELQHADELRKEGLPVANRYLAYGASGTGKTLSTKAFANDLDYTLLMVDISQALAQGNAADSVSRVFKLAAELKYCVIFFDEVDAIAWNRDASSGDGGDMRRATNTLLQYMDQMCDTNIFVACTNMLPRIDVAFERRFDFKLEFNRPELPVREAVSRFIKPNFRLIDDACDVTQDIIQKRMRLSYHAIEKIAFRAMKRAVLYGNGSRDVSLRYIYDEFLLELRIKQRYRPDDTGDPTGTMVRKLQL